MTIPMYPYPGLSIPNGVRNHASTPVSGCSIARHA